MIVVHRHKWTYPNTVCGIQRTVTTVSTEWITTAMQPAIEGKALLCNECWYTATYAMPTKHTRENVRKLLTPRKTQ